MNYNRSKSLRERVTEKIGTLISKEIEMTLEKLIEMGLTEEQAKKVLEAYKAAIDGKYEPKERNEQLREQLKAEKQKVTDRDKQIADLSKTAGLSEDLQKKLQEMEEENKKKDAENAKKLAEVQMNAALRAGLAGKVHDVDLTMTLFDTSKIKLDANGVITEGFKEQFEKLSKDKAYLFIEKGGNPAPKPSVKLFGKGVEEGAEKKTDGEENSGVKYAKEAAARKNSATESSKKAADAYFGGKK